MSLKEFPKLLSSKIGLGPKDSAFIFNVFPSKFYNEALAVCIISKIRYALSNNSYTSDASVWRCSEEYVESMEFY